MILVSWLHFIVTYSVLTASTVLVLAILNGLTRMY